MFIDEDLELEVDALDFDAFDHDGRSGWSRSRHPQPSPPIAGARVSGVMRAPVVGRS